MIPPNATITGSRGASIIMDKPSCHPSSTLFQRKTPIGTTIIRRYVIGGLQRRRRTHAEHDSCLRKQVTEHRGYWPVRILSFSLSAQAISFPKLPGFHASPLLSFVELRQFPFLSIVMACSGEAGHPRRRAVHGTQVAEGPSTDNASRRTPPRWIGYV